MPKRLLTHCSKLTSSRLGQIRARRYEPAIRAAKILHYGSITLIDEPVRGATLHAIETAKDAGCLISCDPNLRLALWPNREAALQGLRLALSRAQFVKLSDEELVFLTGSDDPAAARRHLWHDEIELMVITRGPEGCVYLTPDFDGEVPGFDVEAVDTTGAGDGFVAGLLQGLVRDRAVLGDQKALGALCGFACAVGALTTTERGGIPALPGHEALRRFLEHQPLAT